MYLRFLPIELPTIITIRQLERSGVVASANHTWFNNGNHIIKVKASDVNGTESNWATLTVSMTKNKLSNIILFRIFEKLFYNLVEIMKTK